MKIKRFYDKNIHKEVNPNDITFIDVENGEVKKVGYDVKMGIVTHHIDTNNFDLEFEQEKVMTDRHVDFKYTCGKCVNEVDVEDIYCKTCGTKILWENKEVNMTRRLLHTIETDIALAKRKMLSPRLSEQRLATKKLGELYAELEEFYIGKKPNSTKPKQLEKFHAEGTE